MGHTDKRIWEYLRLSRSTDPITTANPASADNRGQLTVYREPGAQDLLYLSRQTNAGPGFYEWTTAMFAQDSATLLQYPLTDGLAIIVSGSLASTTSPEVTSIIVDGLIRWGAVNGTPTINYEAGAGTGPSNKAWVGGDYCGHLTFKTGTATGTGAQISFVFQNALANANYRPSAMSFGSAGATVQPYISAQASTGWTLAFAVAPAVSTTYQFEIGIAGR